ncbi:MAG: hypothetical protein IJF39_05185 [Clostridia bacterium]|nr:hypothetical protein [Clostridia bacterium]
MAKNERANNQGNTNQNGNRRERRGRRERSETATVKKSGIGGKIVCLLLGFVMGVVGTVGGVGGLGYYAITQVKIKDAIGTVNNLAGLEIDYTQYINEQYGDTSVFGLIESVIGAVGELQGETGSLNTLNEISPMVGTGVQTLIDTVSAYGIKIDYEGLMSAPFSTLADFLSTTINDTDVALLIESVTQNPVEGVLAMICYGEPGKDYVLLEDGTVQMLGNATSATIGSLANADALSERLNGLTFYSLMDALGEVDAEDPIVRALVYGEENVDYIVNTDGSITPLPLTYQLNASTDVSNPEAMKFTSPDGVVFTPSAEGVWTDASNNVIQLREDTATYQFDVLDSEQNLVYNLKFLRADGDLQQYQAYIGDVAQTRKGPYLSEVFGPNADLMSVIGGLPLGDILKLNGTSDPIMLAIAYGEKDVDYFVDGNNEIVPINPPITVNDMIGGAGLDFVKDIPLSTVLNVSSPLQSGVDSLMIILAYGEEDVNYELIDTDNDGINDDWKWLNDENGNPYSEHTIGYLMGEESSSLFNNLTIETLMNISATSAPLMRALAYGNESTHYVLVGSAVKMLPKRYYITDTHVYDEEHIHVGSLVETLQNGISSVHIFGEDALQYVKTNPDGGYDVFPSQEAAETYTQSNDLRLYHAKTKLRDLRGQSAQTCIERIELAAALGVDIFGEGDNAPDPLMLQLAYGTEGVHYTLDETNKKIIWHKDTDPNSETYGLYFHARTIHDMKDTHALLESVYLDTVLGLTYQSPAIMLSLAYGNDYVISGDTISYTTRNTVGDLMGEQSATLIEGIEMQKIITNVDSDDAMMNYILYNMTHPDENAADYKVRTLGDFMHNSSTIIEGMMNTLTLREALGEEATSSGILHGLRDTQLNKLGSEIEKLTLKEVLGDDISTHPILKNMQDSTLATIDDDLSALTIQQLMDDGEEDGIYQYATVNGQSVKAVQVKENNTLVWKEVLPKDTNGYRTWVFADAQDEQAPSPLKGAWKYLLVDNTGVERLYVLEDMNTAMNNIPLNLEKATLQNLVDDDLLTLSSEGEDDVLTTDIIYEFAGEPICEPFMNGTTVKTKLGELTVSEAVNYLTKMMAKIR